MMSPGEGTRGALFPPHLISQGHLVARRHLCHLTERHCCPEPAFDSSRRSVTQMSWHGWREREAEELTDSVGWSRLSGIFHSEPHCCIYRELSSGWVLVIAEGGKGVV